MTILELLISNGYAPGSYFNVCHECKAEFIGDKRAITCLECASKRVGNVAEPNAYSLLADVRAMKQKNNGYEFIGYGDMYIDGYNHAIDDVLKILSEHFR